MRISVCLSEVPPPPVDKIRCATIGNKWVVVRAADPWGALRHPPVADVDRRPVHYVESGESDDELEADEVDSDTALTSSEALVGGALVAIIVAPIAAVLVIVAVIVAVVCCCRKTKEEKASATGSADVASVQIKTSV